MKSRLRLGNNAGFALVITLSLLALLLTCPPRLEG